MQQTVQSPSLFKTFSLVLAILVVGTVGYAKLHRAESHQAAAAASTSAGTQADTGLQQVLANWTAQQSFSSSVVVQELTGPKRSASLHAEASTVTASTYKLYIAYAALHGVEQGTYQLDDQQDDGDSLQTDLTDMIVSSDNDAGRTLGFLIGWKSANSLLASQGLTSTDLYNYTPSSTTPVGDKYTTAADLSVFLQKLYRGQLLNAADTKLLLGLMQDQQYRERIPAGVPSGVAVADKPGWLTDGDDGSTVVQNDAGIVYGPKSTYILVITTTGNTTQPLADLSKSVYNYLEQ